MRVLLVFAHPLRASFVGALHQELLNGLKDNQHEVDDLDLYADRYSPVLDAEERRHYHDENFPHEVLKSDIDRLMQAEALVLCFPTWWYGFPAILKGWFDRVWRPGVAFHLPLGGGVIQPGLKNIRRLIVVTTYGSPWWFIRFVMRDPLRAVIRRGLGRLLAPDVKIRFFVFYNVDGASASARERFIGQVRRGIYAL